MAQIVSNNGDLSFGSLVNFLNNEVSKTVPDHHYFSILEGL
jgi:hypothetical protein